jgi:hypothetical protein
VTRLHVETVAARPKASKISEPDPRIIVALADLAQSASQLREAAETFRDAPPIFASTDASSMRVLKMAGDILARALSIRAMLLLALLGAFVLAVSATDYLHLGVLVAYAVLVVLPVVWLELRRDKSQCN